MTHLASQLLIRSFSATEQNTSHAHKTGVRVVHLPTGTTVESCISHCYDENKKDALQKMDDCLVATKVYSEFHRDNEYSEELKALVDQHERLLSYVEQCKSLFVLPIPIGGEGLGQYRKTLQKISDMTAPKSQDSSNLYTMTNKFSDKWIT